MRLSYIHNVISYIDDSLTLMLLVWKWVKCHMMWLQNCDKRQSFENQWYISFNHIKHVEVLLYIKTLTHWGRETHICVGEHTNIDSDNGLSPNRRQAIIWTNARILLIERLGTNFNEILIKIHTFSLKKMHLKMLSEKWRPFCLGLNVLSLFFPKPTVFFFMEIMESYPVIHLPTVDCRSILC